MQSYLSISEYLTPLKQLKFKMEQFKRDNLYKRIYCTKNFFISVLGVCCQQNKHPPTPTTCATTVAMPLIVHILHLHTITRATLLATQGPQLHPLHPEAQAKNKLIMSQRVFHSRQCILLISGAAGKKKYWLIWTGSGSPLHLDRRGRRGEQWEQGWENETRHWVTEKEKRNTQQEWQPYSLESSVRFTSTPSLPPLSGLVHPGSLSEGLPRDGRARCHGTTQRIAMLPQLSD